MPTYEYRCTACDHPTTANRAIAERDDCPSCPVCLNSTERQLMPSTPPGARVFTPYAARSGGVPAHVMREASQDGQGNWHKPVRDVNGNVIGSRQINQPGEKLNARGDVVITSSGERKTYLETGGYGRIDPEKPLVDLRDVGGHRGVVEENQRRQSKDADKVARARKRLKRGEEAAKRGRRRPGGWG